MDVETMLVEVKDHLYLFSQYERREINELDQEFADDGALTGANLDALKDFHDRL